MKIIINQGIDLHCFFFIYNILKTYLLFRNSHNINTSYLFCFSSLSLESHAKEISALFIKGVRALYVLLKNSSV